MEPFKTFYVRRQGLTKPCCFMLDEAPALGDVTTSPSLDVWQGPGYQAVRQASLESTYPETGCGTCIRNRDGPPEHFAAYLFERYANWFQDAFGVRFEAEPGLLISDARTIGELHSARVELSSIIPGGSTSSHLEVEGFLDLLSTDHVEGWAWLPSHGEARLPLTIWVDSRMIGRTVARDYRPDVHAVGKGDGRCGFRFCFPECDRPRSGSSVSVTVADTPRQLPGSPRIFVGDA
jgi:hypothetical protein